MRGLAVRNGSIGPQGVATVLRLLETYEKWITGILILLMSVVVAFSIIDLARAIVLDILKPPTIFIEVADLLDLFGLFLLVLIGVELLDTIRAYLKEHVVHEEVILGAALIAVARKVIVLDIKEYNGLQLVGIGVVILAVTAAYWITRRAHARKAESKNGPVKEN
jgi:uncharacterized membrane protein (DUF373 family)